MDQTESEFLLEIEELLERIYDDLEALRNFEMEGRYRREVVDRLFRHVHSVKGSSAACGLPSLSRIAHEFENLLDAARSGQFALDDIALDTCDNATDVMIASLKLSATGIAESPVSNILEELKAAAHGRGSAHLSDADAILQRTPAHVWQKLRDAERHRLVIAVREGNRLFSIATGFSTARFDEEFFSLKKKLAQWGEVLSTSPTVDALRPDQINFRVLYASAVESERLRENLKQFPNVVLSAVDESENSSPKTFLVPTNQSSVSALANFVRTDLDTLDRLISSTHQLFRSTSKAFELTNNRSAEIEQLMEKIKASFLSVEEELINLRMVSLGPTLQRAARAGKTASRLTGKEIDFSIKGGDLRIDKLLAEAIADPLIHLCRNAVDHGIEDPERRIKSGKSRRGTIHVEATNECGRVSVRVTDDGRGIDPEVISAASKRLGISNSEEGLNFERSLRLIFRPGFTTVEEPSELSGRGVGLDVVETAVEQVGGELRVSSKPGVGTVFEIRLPVTFGLMDATVVVSGGHRYCLSARQTELAPSADSEPEATAGQLVQYSLRDLMGLPGNVTQTFSLGQDSVGKRQQTSPVQGKVITCQFSKDRNSGTEETPNPVGILVDDIAGQEKVLVRSLGQHAGRWYGVAGATELRDGTVALVLDLPRLLSSAYGEPVKNGER